jgi:hypothetical protein
VGIGSAAPGALLEVDGTTGEGITIDMNSGNSHLNFATGGTNEWTQFLVGEDLWFYDDSAARLVLEKGGNVGIGTTTPKRPLSACTGNTKSYTSVTFPVNLIQTNESSGFSQLGVYFTGAASQDDRITHFQPSEDGVSNQGIIEMNPDGGKFRAKQGIHFGTDTAAANALDDYEEGTFTPVMAGASSGTAVSYSAQGGRYTKVGNMVSFLIDMTITDKGTLGGALKITGLPFTNPNSTGAVGIQMANVASPYLPTARVMDSEAFMYLFYQQYDSSAAKVQLVTANITDATAIYIAGHYLI